MDPRLGVIDPGLRCRTCGKGMGADFGHFGYIELTKPVINVLYSKLIYKILKVVCRSCGRVTSASTTSTPKKCPHCGEELEKIKFEKPYTFFEGERILTLTEVRERLEKIPDEDLEILGMRGGRPEWFLITLLPVSPVTMRPSITLESGERSEDDLTHKLVDIIRINRRLKENIEIFEKAFPNSITENEARTFKEVKKLYDKKLKVRCTGCSYCMPCPSGVDIPGVLWQYNKTFTSDSEIINIF